MKYKAIILLITGSILSGCSMGTQKSADSTAVHEAFAAEPSIMETTKSESAVSETVSETSLMVTSTEITVSETGGYHKITAEEAMNMMEEGKVTIVDVRTREEYNSGHIKNAMLVPVEQIGEDSLEELPDKKAVLLVYCRSGRRSRQAADKLVELGYEQVYDFGGIIDWPYETEAEEN